MNLDQAWIIKWNPCPEGTRFLRARKSRNVFKVLEALLRAKRYEWAEWVLCRLLSKESVAEWVEQAEWLADGRRKQRLEALRRKNIREGIKLLKKQVKK
jgi:hypothetical protein